MSVGAWADEGINTGIIDEVASSNDYINDGALLESNALRAGNRLDITRYQQERTLWCWAATVQMVAKYETGRKVSQSSIVKYIKGSVVNQTGKTSDQVKALKYIDSDAFADADYWSADTLSRFEKYVQKNQDKDHPTILMCSEGKKIGHSLVVQISKGDFVELIDPWKDTENEVYSKDDIVNNGFFCSAVNGYVTSNGCVVY